MADRSYFRELASGKRFHLSEILQSRLSGQWTVVAAQRIAVAGLNPHCGEGGILGKEDDEIIAPVVREYADRGFSGPWPGDTVFIKLRARQYDAVVAMFHDQGHIPVKLLGFQVDPETGIVRLVKYTAVDDLGRVINPMICEGQVHGGVAQGVGCGHVVVLHPLHKADDLDLGIGEPLRPQELLAAERGAAELVGAVRILQHQPLVAAAQRLVFHGLGLARRPQEALLQQMDECPHLGRQRLVAALQQGHAVAERHGDQVLDQR